MEFMQDFLKNSGNKIYFAWDMGHNGPSPGLSRQIRHGWQPYFHLPFL